MGGSTITSIVLLLASVGLFFGVIDPNYDRIDELENRNAQLDDALLRALNFRDALVDLRSQYNLVPAENKDRLQKFLPDHVDNIRLIINIDGIADEHDILIGDFSIEGGSDPQAGSAESSGQIAQADPADDANGGSYDSLVLSFGATGTYDDFLSFMADLERSLRIVDISSASVTPADPSVSHQDALYSFTLSIKTYWLL